MRRFKASLARRTGVVGVEIVVAAAAVGCGDASVDSYRRGGTGMDVPLPKRAVLDADPTDPADPGEAPQVDPTPSGPVGTCTLETAPVVPAVDAATRSAIRDVFKLGQTLGRRADVFMKFGDSLTDNLSFLVPLATTTNVASAAPELASLVATTTATTTPDGQNPFTSWSLGARRGWTTAEMLTANTTDFIRFLRPTTNDRAGWTSPYASATWENPWTTRCAGKNAVECELGRLNGAYAVLLIGSGDTNLIRQGGPFTADTYEANLRAIVKTLTGQGVVVILSTLPPIADADAQKVVLELNARVLRIAGELGNVPVWNLYRQVSSLPNQGLSGDGLHLSCVDPGIGANGFSACLDDPPGEGQAGQLDPTSVQAYGANARNLGFLRAYQHVRDLASADGGADAAPCTLAAAAR